MWQALLLLLGLGLLILGGELLVRGAVSLAHRLGVPSVIVGLTVVAFGTSTPELVVNLSAGLRGESAIGFGNVVGSNIANVGLLLAIGALIAPLTIHQTIVRREIPMLALASASTLVLGLDRWTGGSANHFARGDGIALLMLFGVFLYYTLADALAARQTSQPDQWTAPEASQPAHTTLAITGLVLGGLLLLIGGGELTVRSAVHLAQTIGLSEKVIGLTLVAVGTSLPELATTLSAARQKRSDLAVGNIVGSNIYNLLFIWGLTLTIAPAELPTGGAVDVVIMLLFAIVLLPMALTQRRFGRLEAGVLLVGYLAYVAWLALL